MKSLELEYDLMTDKFWNPFVKIISIKLRNHRLYDNSSVYFLSNHIVSYLRPSMQTYAYDFDYDTSSLAYDPISQSIIVADRKSNLHIMKINTSLDSHALGLKLNIKESYKEHKFPIEEIMLNPSNNEILTYGSDHMVYRWIIINNNNNVGSQQFVFSEGVLEQPVSALTVHFDPVTRYFFRGCHDGMVTVYGPDAIDGEYKRIKSIHVSSNFGSRAITAINYDANSDIIMIGSNSSYAKFYRGHFNDTTNEIISIEISREQTQYHGRHSFHHTTSLQYSTKHKTIFGGHFCGAICVYKYKTNVNNDNTRTTTYVNGPTTPTDGIHESTRRIKILYGEKSGDANGVQCMLYDDDLELLFCGHWNSKIKIWSCDCVNDSYINSVTLTGSTGTVWNLALDAANHTLYSIATGEKKLRVWKMQTHTNTICTTATITATSNTNNDDGFKACKHNSSTPNSYNKMFQGHVPPTPVISQSESNQLAEAMIDNPAYPQYSIRYLSSSLQQIDALAEEEIVSEAEVDEDEDDGEFYGGNSNRDDTTTTTTTTTAATTTTTTTATTTTTTTNQSLIQSLPQTRPSIRLPVRADPARSLADRYQLCHR